MYSKRHIFLKDFITFNTIGGDNNGNDNALLDAMYGVLSAECK